jgi:fumarylacetoacetase
VSWPIDRTHDPTLTSWVDTANDPDGNFPIQNLPFGRFRTEGDSSWRIGVAIGDRVLDLRAARLLDSSDMRRVLAAPPSKRHRLRQILSEGLRTGSDLQTAWQSALYPQAAVELGLPCDVGDYTDFYSGIHHAVSAGKLFRPDDPLLPNYKWVPVGYHGRASSICASGHTVRRPWGQLKANPAEPPALAPTARLDYELELGIVIGRANELGQPVSITDAEDHVFGLTLLNDWSARDVQAWEYQPLGPFLAKNFATTLSPWIVTLEALAPFREPFVRPDGDPAPLPYLDSTENRASGVVGIELEVWLQTARMRATGEQATRLSTSNYRDAYWTLAQLVAHHTVNGCNLQTGDVLGSGTISGPAPDQGGSLLELSQGGKQAVALGNGETRRFLDDGDSVILRARCRRDGYRDIGFGECRATVEPARAS